MDRTLRSFYGPIEDENISNIIDLGIKYTKEVINSILNNIFLQIIDTNEKSLLEHSKIEEEKFKNLKQDIDFKFGQPKEIKYKKKFSDNKGVYYYPLTKNFISIEEEKKFNHYYGEEYVDRVSRIDKSNKKESYLQDDLITNLIFLFLINSKITDYDLLKSIKSTFKIKNFSRNDIIKRIKLLYDRYHGFLDEGKSEFWYMSCKMPEIKNILTLFQNNKQIYCNIDNIYDCSLHSSNDPNFDNPSCYDQIKYLKSYKKLLEYSVDYLYKGINEIVNNNDNHMIIDNNNDNEINDESIQNSLSRSEDKKNKEAGKINNLVYNENNMNNDLISNASSKIQSYNNSKENEEINSEIILENKDGSTKIIYLNKKKDDEITNNVNNINNINNVNNVNIGNNKDALKNHIIDLILEFNQTLKNIKCHSSVVSHIKKVKYMLKEEKKPCSELCYKNFLLCDENIYNQSFILSINKEFPVVYELLFIKFLQMVKFDPCRIFKLMKSFINIKDNENNSSFKLNCSDIYIHLLSQKFRLKNIIKKELFDLNIKERELGKKCRASLTPIQSKKIEENHLKKQNLTYIPCVHFGNEICDEKCPCSKRGYCEIYCKCNQILCKFASHGCHCSKGDCTTNHCPCYINGRECNPQKCKNCNIINNNDRCKNIQLQQDFESKLIVGMSDIAGWGLFANEDIKKDSLIGEYKGELINDDIVNKRDKFKDYEGSTYMFKLDDEYTVDSRRMGNMLRYANHSKINSNSYTKIIFSRGHRKIGLFAKKNIKKGEEILFDYDGQGILVKQFSWINNEKKLTNHNVNNEKASSNINSVNNSNNINNINNSNTNINNNEKTNIININVNNDIINNNINIINNHINTNINNNIFSKRKPKTRNVGTSSIINLIDDSTDKDKIFQEKNNNKKEISLKEIVLKNEINENIINKNDTENPILEKKEQKNEHTNLIDMLSDKNFCQNKTNHTKYLFKTEEDQIKDIRSNYEKNKDKNIFDLMIKIRENLSRGERTTRFISRKRSEPTNENLYQTNNLNFGINLNNNTNNNNNINESNIINNNENKDNIIDNIFQKNQNLKSPLFQEVKKYIEEKDEIQNEKEMKINIEIDKEENEFKLRTPIFAGEIRENNKTMNDDYSNKNKISYNFITCEYFNNNNPLNNQIKKQNSNHININNNYNSPFNIPELSNSNFNFINNNISTNNSININNEKNFNKFNNNLNTINNNISLINNLNNHEPKIKISNTIYNLSTIRVLLKFENPIINDFSFYSNVNTDKLKKIENLEVKPLDLTEYNLNIDFDKDICGYLIKNISNNGSRIFKDYLDCFESKSYYCYIPEINCDLYIISKGPYYNQIDKKYDFNIGKNKKLFFIIKNK